MTTAAGRECVLGVDVSMYQPADIDWAQVATARRFAWLKASGGDGSLYPDPHFLTYRDRSAGHLPRGAYHFMGAGNGAGQADYFVRVTNGYAGLELPPVIDFETYGNHGQYRPSAADLAAFLQELHVLIPHRWTGPTGQPIAATIYTGAVMAGNLPAGVEVFDLALAAYLNPHYGNPWDGVTNGAEPNLAPLGNPDRYIPRPWSTWSAWQFAGGDGGAPAIGNGRTNCDQDALTTEALTRLTTLTEGGLSMADAQDILDELKTLREQLGGDANDTRALEGQAPLKLPESDKQYLVVWSDKRDGWVKRWISGQPEDGVLTKQNVIQRAAAALDPAKGLVPYRELVGDEADWLRDLPEV